MTTLRRVVANGGWWLLERAGALLLTLVTSVVVVRALGPAQYGELSYLLAITGLLAPLAQFGISGLVARALLERPTDERAVLRAAMQLRLAGCALAFVAGVVYWLALEHRPADRWMLLVLLAAQFATVTQVVEFWFQVQFKAARLVPWRTGAAVVAAILKMALAVTTHDARWVAAAFALEFLLVGAAAWTAMRRAGDGLSTCPRPRTDARETVPCLAALVRPALAVAAGLRHRRGHLPAHRHRAARAPARRRGDRHLRRRRAPVRGLVHGAGGTDGRGVSGAVAAAPGRRCVPAWSAGIARPAVRAGRSRSRS